MAQQATATHRKKEAVPPAFASISASDIVRAPTGQRAIPLDLQPLLKPFKRSGRLALRIERLPQRAKLSAGRRNSDGSWSLGSDELEELNYLIPSNIVAAHELTIRVMKFDEGAASTLKVIQYPIASCDAEPEQVGNDGAICRSSEAHDPVLRSQLGEMQSLFAVRESELTALRAALEQMKAEKATELEKARLTWEQELKKRLAEMAARVQPDKKRDHDARDGDHHVIAQAEARAEQRFLARLEQASKQAEQRLASERKAWQAESNTYVAAERQKWQTETERCIEAERQKCLAEADKRIAAEFERLTLQADLRVEAERRKWLSETDKQAVAEQEHLKTQAEHRIESERLAWQADADQRMAAELSRQQAEMERRIQAERRIWQGEAEQSAAVELERLKAEIDQRVQAERQAWQAQADQHSATELAQAKAQTEQRIQSERQAWQADTDQRLAAERQRLQAEAEQHVQAERKSWLAEAEQRAQTERGRWEAESRAALAKAAEQWKAEESERSTAALKEWQQQAARMLAQEADKSSKLEATLAAEADKGRKLEAALAVEAEKSRKLETALEALVQAKSISVPGDGSQELDRLRGELALTQANLAERDSELAQHRAEMEQERDRWRREAEASFETAAKAWKAEETARLDAMAAKSRAQSEEALAEMAARCEKAERGLAEARSQASASLPADDGYIESLRVEISELRTALANQEVELGWARAALDESQPLHLRRAGENLPITNFEAPPSDEPEPDPNAGTRKTLVRDCLLVIGLVIPLIVFYPWIAAYLPDNVQASISSATGGLLSAGNDHPAATHTITPPAPPPPVQRPMATVSKSVNVRATPAVKGDVVVTLQKDASVVVLERQGNWTRVEVPAKDGAAKAQQGWVYSTYLDAQKAAK